MAEKTYPYQRAGRPVSSRRSARVAEKLQQKIRDKEYYEAHQTYRVLYQRYKAQGKESEALELLYDGATLLLQHGQWSSGSDLGMLLVAHLKEQKTPVSDQWLEKIGNLFCQYTCTGNTTSPSPSDASQLMDTSESDAPLFEVVPEVESREGLIRAALKWSNIVAEGDKWKHGHPQLHKVAAMVYWREKQYGKAREHFLYAEQPQEFGNMLVELATTFGYSGEADLFISQAVLQLLVLKNRKDGLAVFNTYTRKHPKFKSENPPYVHHPTLNFVWFLLSACKDRSREVFNCLRVNYAPSINRDPSFKEYLDKIGDAFFGPPNQSHPAGESAVPGPSGILGLGGAGSFIEGILNSISSALPQATAAGTSNAPPNEPMSSVPPAQRSSQGNFTIHPGSAFSHHVGPIEFGPGGQISQTQHIHLGAVAVPPPGEIPPEGIQLDAPLGGVPFALPPGAIPFVPPGNVRFGTPQVNIRLGPPQTSNRPRPPRTSNIQPGPPLPRNHPRVGNIRFGPPHISVVGFRMEGVPMGMPGGAMGMGHGPVITPAQQQLYQQHAQQQVGNGEQQNSATGGQRDSQEPPPHPNDDMELD